MSLAIVKPGLLSTIQDLGRPGYGKLGVIVSGAMDAFAHRAANWLTGNDEAEAAIEITWSGFSVRFEQDMWIALTGGNLGPVMAGMPVPMWRPVFVRSGSVLAFQKPVSGFRAYLAAAGGMDVPVVLNSRSTYMRAGIGGMKGRALAAGDEISIGKSALNPPRSNLLNRCKQPFYAVNWSIPPSLFPEYDESPVIRAIYGNQYHDFDEESRALFFSQTYKVGPQSDRMGYRLIGPKLRLRSEREYVSEAVSLGTVQVPADGQPIILMADRQTHGGYPKIAQVTSIDIPVIAQIPPGASVTFRSVTLAQAEAAYLEWNRKISGLKTMIRFRLKEDFHA